MTQLYQSKIFANGSTTLPKPVRDALGVKAGDHVGYVICEDGVQVLRTPLDDNSLKFVQLLIVFAALLFAKRLV
mgnify:CR=1 FL=1